VVAGHVVERPGQRAVQPVHGAQVVRGQQVPPIVSYFRCLLNEQFTAGRMLGPRQLIATTLAQIQVLGRLRRHAPTGTADDAVRLLALYAEFAGRLDQDAGDSKAAMYWSDRATDWAQAAGNYQMAAYLMLRETNIALLNQDPAR
jgi:hypothetical protein